MKGGHDDEWMYEGQDDGDINGGQYDQWMYEGEDDEEMNGQEDEWMNEENG